MPMNSIAFGMSGILSMAYLDNNKNGKSEVIRITFMLKANKLQGNPPQAWIFNPYFHSEFMINPKIR